jgi:ParB family chromosome partitioning protein
VAIADNAANRQLNRIEQSIALSGLSGYYQDDTELSRIAAKLGMRVAPSLVPKLKRLCRFPEPLQQGVLSGTISLTVALELGSLEEPSAVALAQLFELLKPTLNHQKEILTLAREISLIRDVSVPCLLNEGFVGEIIHHPDLSRNQKIRALLDALKRRRYPVIAGFEDKFQDLIGSLELPGKIKVIPPKNFEGGMYAILLNFQTLSEIKAQVDFLDRLIQRPEFGAILMKEIADH